MKHICVATSAHPWDDVRVSSRVTASFLDAGYRVTWVGPDRALSSDQGEKHSDVDYRLFELDPGRVGRLKGASRAMHLAREVRDVDWWYSPDPDMARRLPRLSRRNGGHTLFDVHESFHQGLLQRWFPGNPPHLLRELVRRRIADICAKCDLVIGVSGRVLEPYCSDRSHALVIRNLAPAWFAPAFTSRAADSGDSFKIIHGKLSSGNGTSQVAAALPLLPRDVQRRIRVLMLDVATTSEGVRNEVSEVAARLSPDTISLMPGVSHEEMSDLMANHSVGLISYQRDLGYESLPNRLFEYMAAGVAILAPSYSPEIVRILETEKIGLAVDFEVPEEIAKAINWCVNNPAEVDAMGARARRAYIDRYTWAREAERLLSAMALVES